LDLKQCDAAHCGRKVSANSMNRRWLQIFLSYNTNQQQPDDDSLEIELVLCPTHRKLAGDLIGEVIQKKLK